MLRRLDRHEEARRTLSAAGDSLGRLNNPRPDEAADELRELDGVTGT
ncbi:hypothetical protein [Streptomyces sp. NRRL B-24484]|nr:hypothetical protein [Streptomyces sp. NRRL B-24484]